MSVVYRGHDTALDREVAVKVLHPHLADRPESRARFSREARAVARLSHPNIVEIFDYSGDGAPESWLVTEFVHGRTLRVFADEVGFERPELAALVCRALADALVHAHAAGVIHRDLKPENVMVCEERGSRSVKLADFGIARILAQDDRMTMTGALMGSPNHMAPEILEGHEADARSDVFSLGTILYWGCTGKLPFDAPNPTATLRRRSGSRRVSRRRHSALSLGHFFHSAGMWSMVKSLYCANGPLYLAGSSWSELYCAIMRSQAKSGMRDMRCLMSLPGRRLITMPSMAHATGPS